MNTRIFLLGATLSVVGVAIPQASGAGILNGDFESAVDLEHWSEVELAAPDPSYAAVEEVEAAGDDRLRLMAQNTYTWEEVTDPEDPNYPGVWVLDQFLGSIAQAINPADYHLYALVGTTELQFDAKIAIQAPSGGTQDRVWVEVSYNYDGSVFNAVEGLAFSSTEDWSGYVLELPGMDVSKKINLNVYARSGDGLSGAVGEYDGQTVDLIAEAWFDNFQFIPEPTSAAVLCLGLVLIALRRRRAPVNPADRRDKE